MAGDKSPVHRNVKPEVARGSDRKRLNVGRPALAVDTALLTVDIDRRQLLVVEMERADTGEWALPGTCLQHRETLNSAVQRCLDEKLGVRGVRPQQLEVFDDPNRDIREWVISVAHVAVIPREQLKSLGSGLYRTRLRPVDRPGQLVWDHSKILRVAKEYVRDRYAVEADPDRLLDDIFTLRELQRVHEAVAGEELERIHFRRLMEGQVVDAKATKSTGGRPARLFRHKDDPDA